MSVKKIVIFGKGEAGKSTFISTLIPEAVNIHHRGRTIAMDFGTFRHGSGTFHLFGTPGQARFDCLRDIIALNANHALMIFDSSQPLQPDDRAILKEIETLRTPFTGVLNIKKNLPTVLKESEVHDLCKKVNGFRDLFIGDVRDMNFVIAVLTSL